MNKFLTPDKFANSIELIVATDGCSYLDAIQEFCLKNEIEDYVTIKDLIDECKPLKEKIEYEAKSRHLLKNNSIPSRLPF